MATKTLEIVINGRDQFTSVAGRVNGSIRSLQATAGQVGKGIGQVGAGLARVAVVGATAAAGGLLAAAKAGADFQAQLNTINTIAGVSGDKMAAYGDGIRRLAREGRGDLADLSAAYYDILSAGITDTAKAQTVLESSTTLALGSLSTTAEAVDLLTTAINAYGQDASQAGYDADLFAKAVEIGKVKANEIAASFANVAPIAAATGINIEEIAAAYGALTAQGTPAAEVTTQMSRAILDLLSPGKELLALQEKTGKSYMQIARDKGLVVALQEMRDATEGDDQAFQSLFGRVEGYKFALQTTGAQNKVYNSALEAMGKAAGTANRQMGERTQGLGWSVKTLRRNLIDAGIELSQGFLPALERSVRRLTVSLNRPEIRARLRSLGESIGESIDKIDWPRVLDGVEKAVAVMRTMLEIVSKIPPEVDAAVLGFMGLNKVSGGLLGAGISGIVGGIGTGLARGLAQAGIGRAFVQPVFVTNPGFGGGGVPGVAGAAAGGGIGILGKVFLVGEALALLAGIQAVNNEIASGVREQAKSVTETNDAWLKQHPTIPQLQSGLAATQEGMNNGLAFNPLTLGLNLGGARDAYDALKSMEGDQRRALTSAYQQEQLLRENIGTTASVSEAIRYMPPPVVNVNVSLTGREVAEQVKTSTTYGPTSGSYYGGATPPALSH